MMQKLLINSLGLGLVLFLGGCGGGPNDLPELGEVTGKVTIDGNPAKNVVVTFTPEGANEGRGSRGVTNEEGVYTLEYSKEEMGAKVGPHIVKISTPPPAEEEDCSKVPEESEFVDPIPPKYNVDAVDNPEMKKEVKAGPNEFNFEIKSDPGASAKRTTAPPRRAAPDVCGE